MFHVVSGDHPPSNTKNILYSHGYQGENTQRESYQECTCVWPL